MSAQSILQDTALTECNLIEHLDDSARLLLDFIGNIDLVADTPHATHTDTEKAVTAVIGFEGGQHQGMLLLHCSKSLAQRLTNGMIGDTENCEDEVYATLGEVVNMLGHNAKGLLSDQHSHTLFSLPTVFDGTDSFCRELICNKEGYLRCYHNEAGKLLLGVALNKSWRNTIKAIQLFANA